MRRSKRLNNPNRFPPSPRTKVRKLNRGVQTVKTNEETQRSSPSLMDLPTDICLSILLKVSAKSIITCKSVCKTWNRLISDPEFVKKYSSQNKNCLLIKDTCYSRISRTVYSIKPEECHGFYIGHCRCESAGKQYCNSCRRNVRLKEKLKIPLRNVDNMLSSAHDDPEVTFYSRMVNKRKPLIKIKPEDHKYVITNSCNGLLCLTDPLFGTSVAICNPITGEFVCLKDFMTFGYNDKYTVSCGLGFIPEKNQYKMFRMCIRWTENPALDSARFDIVASAIVRTVGTSCGRGFLILVNSLFNEWKDVAPPASISPLKPHSPTYFCGAFYWVFADKSNDSNCKVFSFELDEEQFHFHNVPISPPCETGKRHNLAMGVLKDCLCICDNLGCDRIDIWIMKEYGVWESWTKFLSIDIGNTRGSCNGFYQPLFYLDNGALVLFNSRHNELIHYDKSGGLRFKCFKVRGIQPDIEVLVHSPNSFLSLKDIVKGALTELNVLNVNARCGKLKLLEETNVLLLGGAKD